MSDQDKGNDGVDETLIRQEPNDDKTNIKPPSSAAQDAIEEERNAATVVRQASPANVTPDVESAIDSDETIIRGTTNEPAKDTNATILREPGGDSSDGSNATILREPQSPSSGQATILRSGSDLDDDATIISSNGDDDATVLGAGTAIDTTYVALENQAKSTPRGNTEAGRLLKNRFVLEELIGSGGMGDVYKALDLRLQEAKEKNPYIAIKLLNESFSRHKDGFISLQRETTRTRAIPHPNIMAVYDFDKEGDTVYMTMEKLEGKPLDDYIKEHPEGVSTEDARTIIDGICKGLGRAHDAGIVHSDFKPGNIFWCSDKTAKVFDFGIARAVPKANELEMDGEKTVFDAGSLGALTPAFASYEMLKGMEPTKSDDIYAVALVAYELLTGKHPYNRVPADKAYEQGLVPEPIPHLKRRHWRALKKALELKGENRTQSLDEFHEGMFTEDPPYIRYSAIAAVLIVSIGFGAYQSFFREIEQLPEELVEMEGAIESYFRNLDERIKSPNFTSKDWHDQIETNLNRLEFASIQIQETYPEYMDPLVVKAREEAIQARGKSAVMNTYLAKVRDLRESAQNSITDVSARLQVEPAVQTLEEAQSYLEMVKTKYNFDSTVVNAEEVALLPALQLRQFQLETIAQSEIDEATAVEDSRLLAERREAERLARERRDAQYTVHLEVFKDILRCKGDITDENVARLRVTVSGLRQTHRERFEVDRPGIVAALSGCIEQRIGVRVPERARTIQSSVMTMLPGEDMLANIEIVDIDVCAERRLEGQGVRNRSWCSDKLSVGGNGPELVVIPRKPGVKFQDLFGHPFALSRMEVRIGDYNLFCESTGCSKLSGASSLPATNISIEQANRYVAWLSDQSGRTYRLPSADEWLYAASTAENEGVDDNVNCTVDARGVRLGEKLLNSLSGRPNSWGLYNHVGNAQEWAMAADNQLIALGGAHTDPKAECTLSKRVDHSGEADPVTGFRVIRVIFDTNAAEPQDIAGVSQN